MYPELSRRKGLKLYEILIFPSKSRILGDSVAYIFNRKQYSTKSANKENSVMQRLAVKMKNTLKHMVGQNA